MKKTFWVFGVIILALAISGCNNASGITEPTTRPTSPVTPVQTTAPTTPPTTPAPTEPTTVSATTPASTEPTTAPVEQTDEWEMFRWGKYYAEKHGGVYLQKGYDLYFISKDYSGSTYVVGDNSIPGVRDMIYDAGIRKEKTVQLYEYQFFSSKLAGIISYGNVPVVIVDSKSDIVVGYLSSEPLVMPLKKVVFYGYSLPITTNTTNAISVEQNPNGVPLIIRGDISKMSIADKDGNTPEDFRDLVFGESYTISWYEGTKYYEFVSIADCSYYVYPEIAERIELQGTLTKDGYCTFDFSNVEPGFYETQGGIIIEVK